MSNQDPSASLVQHRPSLLVFPSAPEKPVQGQCLSRGKVHEAKSPGGMDPQLLDFQV